MNPQLFWLLIVPWLGFVILLQFLIILICGKVPGAWRGPVVDGMAFFVVCAAMGLGAFLHYAVPLMRAAGP